MQDIGRVPVEEGAGRSFAGPASQMDNKTNGKAPGSLSARATVQARLVESIDSSDRQVAGRERQHALFSAVAQRQGEKEEPLQGKFAVQCQPEKDELTQQDSTGGEAGAPIPASSGGDTGMPDHVQAKMEGAFNTSFSDVKVHTNSSSATNVGAVAYTRGSDVHFAPGQYTPESSGGQKLLGHELAHVVQQREGRVQPTTEIAGLPLNDSPALEKEADLMGEKIS